MIPFICSLTWEPKMRGGEGKMEAGDGFPAGGANTRVITVEEIRRRLDALKAHQNDPFSYDAREIFEVRELHDHAPEDLEFLLHLLQRVDDLQREVDDFRMRRGGHRIV